MRYEYESDRAMKADRRTRQWAQAKIKRDRIRAAAPWLLAACKQERTNLNAALHAVRNGQDIEAFLCTCLENVETAIGGAEGKV